jgi:hypothetical protein
VDPPSTDIALTAWVVQWAATYPNPDREDEFLRRFANADHFTREQVDELIAWKFQSDPRRRANARRRIATERNDDIVDFTARAIRCNDELCALLLVTQLHGIGPALGSAALMAAVPARYTVMDTRALASLRSLGLLGPGSDQAITSVWPAYLESCRQLASTLNLPPRTIDRALFKAAGAAGLPVPN